MSSSVRVLVSRTRSRGLKFAETNLSPRQACIIGGRPKFLALALVPGMSTGQAPLSTFLQIYRALLLHRTHGPHLSSGMVSTFTLVFTEFYGCSFAQGAMAPPTFPMRCSSCPSDLGDHGPIQPPSREPSNRPPDAQMRHGGRRPTYVHLSIELGVKDAAVGIG